MSQGVRESDPYTLAATGFQGGEQGAYHDETRPSHETTFTTGVYGSNLLHPATSRLAVQWPYRHTEQAEVILVFLVGS